MAWLSTQLSHTALYALILIASGCAVIPSPESRTERATLLAERHDWAPSTITTGAHKLQLFTPSDIPSSPLEEITIYIEGDGLSWVSKTRPSMNPTPNNPVGLKLAVSDPDKSVFYIGRPCQYIKTKACKVDLWATGRFSEIIITATNDAISSIKEKYGFDQAILVGFSGGAAVATLISAQRKDVKGVITVSGNIDHQAWSIAHKLTPLRGSLNPIDFVDQLSEINQYHIYGSEDQNTTEAINSQYADKLKNKPTIRTIQGQGHECCWDTIWEKEAMKAKEYIRNTSGS